MSRRLLSAAILLAGTSGLSSLLYAAADPADLIKYRKNTMAALGGHAGAISLIVRGKVEHAADLLSHARALDATIKTIEGVFPKESAEGDTAAKPEIWQKPEEFKKAIDRAEAAAGSFLMAVESGDKEQIGARFKDLGGACKNCHDDFRKEEKK